MGLIQKFLSFLAAPRLRREELVEIRFQRNVQRKFWVLVRAYEKSFGRVINTDMAKELCPEYSSSPSGRAKYSRCVYAPAKAFADRLYTEWIKDPASKFVMFLAGGAGSGKSSAATSGLEAWSGLKEGSLVVDGTLSSFETALSQIELALESGKPVLILYVFCPISTALHCAIRRGMDRGRTVSLEAFTGTHIASQRTVLGSVSV